MSEYLSKKAVLEWLESEMSTNKGHPDDIDIHWTLNRVSKKIQSGAFDADESEVQRHGDWTDERCPKCGANLLGNKVGDKWCSLVGCDYGINAPEGDGNDV